MSEDITSESTGPDVGDYAWEASLYLFDDFANTCIAWMCRRFDPPLHNWLPTLPQKAVPTELQAKGVTVQTYSLDKYGRTIGDVLLLDGTNVNCTLVEDGWCWWYRKYAPGDTVLGGLEREAREAKKGLWAAP